MTADVVTSCRFGGCAGAAVELGLCDEHLRSERIAFGGAEPSLPFPTEQRKAGRR